jgi:hypothetical protein
MRALSAQRRELIHALVAEADIGGITAGLLEKDEHLTGCGHTAKPHPTPTRYTCN